VEHFPIPRQWYVASLAGKQLSVVADTFLSYLMEESYTLAEKLLPGIHPVGQESEDKQPVLSSK
jgi:hypothetical protein